MLRFKSYTTASLALIVIFFLLWKLDFGHSPESLGDSENGISSEEARSLKEEVARLKRELHYKGIQLEGAHQALDAQIQSSVENTPQSEASSERKPSKERLDLDLLEKTHQDRVAEVIERSNAVEGYDFRKEQMASYEAEALDEAWARPRERAIEETFAVEKALQGAVLKSVDCKSKRCRIQIYYQSEAEVSQLSGKLNRIILESDDALFVPQVFVSYSEDGEVASLFLGDDVETPLF